MEQKSVDLKTYDNKALIAMGIVTIMALFLPFLEDDIGHNLSMINLMSYILGKGESPYVFWGGSNNGATAISIYAGAIAYAVAIVLLLFSTISSHPFFNFIRVIACLAALLFPVSLVIGIVLVKFDVNVLLYPILLVSVYSVYLIGLSAVKHIPKYKDTTNLK